MESKTKPRSFKQRWNKTALRRIKKECTASDSIFICKASKEFELLWEDHKNEIVELMLKHFPKENNEAYSTSREESGSFGPLFYNNRTKAARLQFLDLEIARLSK